MRGGRLTDMEKGLEVKVGARGSVAGIETLCYKPECRGFDSR
jgi:hypothetical protein